MFSLLLYLKEASCLCQQRRASVHPFFAAYSLLKDLCSDLTMSGTVSSDEVAEDYKGSLEDLISNDRYQISNLTLIARENTEHAEAISRVLQNHISRVSSPCHLLASR